MLKLYEIDKQLLLVNKAIDEWAANHEGEIPESLERELERLEGELTAKLLNLGVWYKSLIAESKAYKDEKDRLAKHQKSLENKAARIKSFIDYNLGEGESLKDIRCTLSHRKSESLVVECMLDSLPEIYVDIKKSARLTDLKQAVKSGEKFEGVYIKENHNLQIK